VPAVAALLVRWVVAWRNPRGRIPTSRSESKALQRSSIAAIQSVIDTFRDRGERPSSVDYTTTGIGGHRRGTGPDIIYASVDRAGDAVAW